MLGTILLILCALVMIVCLRYLYCNSITLRQRKKIIRKCKTPHNFDLYDDVDYDEHLHCLVLFKNPLNLYADEIKALFPKGHL